MDSQINKVHSPTIFCVVLSDLIGFRDASISPSDPDPDQLPRPLMAECLQNLAEFLPFPKAAFGT